MKSHAGSSPQIVQSLTALMLDALSTEVCLVDRDGKILVVNQAWRAFAKTHEAAEAQVSEGANYLRVCETSVGFQADLARKFGDGIRSVLEGQRACFELEYACPAPNKERWFIGFVTPLRFRKEVFGVIAHQDVTERKKSESDLTKAHQRLKCIMDTVPNILYELDLESRLTSWNKQIEHVTLYEPAELLGKSALDLMAEPDRPKIAEAIKTVLNEGSCWVEAHLLTKDGREILYHWNGSAIKDEQGHARGLAGVGCDITERVRLETQLRNQYERLKELDRLKSIFINSITHELRTPLTAIMGFAEFLEDELGGPLAPQQMDFVHELQRGARRLEYLLNDLLDIARLEAGTFRLSLQEADLGRIARECAESLRAQAQRANLKLGISLPARPLLVPMDEQRIAQVLINLIGNALKFTPAGGTIQVRAWRERDVVRCEVIDSGIGIPEAEEPSLFQRFTQLEAGVSKGVGTGLGLSISKSIIDAHGGCIGVNPRKGRGSIFWFTLPSR